MRSRRAWQEHDQEDVLLRIARRTDFDSPGPRLGFVRAQFPDRFAQRAIFVVVSVVDEKLKPAAANGVDNRILGQQDLAFEAAATMPGTILRRYHNAEAVGKQRRRFDRMQQPALPKRRFGCRDLIENDHDVIDMIVTEDAPETLDASGARRERSPAGTQ